MLNKDYNYQASEKYGSGWANEASSNTFGDGYYPDSKLFYNGVGTWGGSSWDNQALFDIQGHPLQSLKFYKDAGNDNKEQLTRLEFVNQDNDIVKTIFDLVIFKSESRSEIVNRSLKELFPEISAATLRKKKQRALARFTKFAEAQGFNSVNLSHL